MGIDPASAVWRTLSTATMMDILIIVSYDNNNNNNNTIRWDPDLPFHKLQEAAGEKHTNQY